MASEERTTLEESLKQYEQQLLAVQLALQDTAGDHSGDLIELKHNLEEVIALTQASLQTSVHATSAVDRDDGPTSDIDDEFAKFQAEISQLSATTEDPSLRNASPVETGGGSGDCDLSDELSRLIEQLEGSKVRVPFSRDWGHTDYHNAVVLSVEAESVERIDDIKLTVMFTHPTAASMKPCSFFLEGHCKFSSDRCRFSHGHVVMLSDVHEYLEPDFSFLRKGSLCLVKSQSDGLWQQATILNWEGDATKGVAGRLIVQMSHSGKTTCVEFEDVTPLADSAGVLSESDSDSEVEATQVEQEDDDDDDVPQVVWVSADAAGSPLGEWEKHTKGIGSKLMEKMGYVWGQGLGVRGNGRIEPVEAVILPQGKSLDKCMELRERGKVQDSTTVQKKMLLKKKKAEARVAAGYHREAGKKSVFDFLNGHIFSKKHAKGHVKLDTICKAKPETETLKEASDKGLSVQSLQVTEAIRRAEREISRLSQSSARNKDRDKVMHSRVEQKIEEQRRLIAELKSRERSIHAEQQHRRGNDKLRIF